MKKLIISLASILYALSVHSENYNDYLQLNIGNIFVYSCIETRGGPGNNCQSFYKLKITIEDTVNYSGRKYYKYARQLALISGSGTCYFSPFMFPFYIGDFQTIRIDSLTGNVYYYNPNCSYSPNEILIDSLNSKLGDVVNIRCGLPYPYHYTCIDTLNRKKYFQVNPYPTGHLRREYERGSGLISSSQEASNIPFNTANTQTLIGSVINGIAAGDTSMYLVGINQSGTETPPDHFELNQNYPNPFNPTTQFGFRIADFGLVRLTVFDAIGREIEVLVNQQLQPGTYEVDWDASSYPSGVYYYRLESGNFTETKKMVLIK